MKKHLLIYLIIYSICSLAGQVRAQERFADRYNITYVTMNEGLPHNFIDDLYKDSRGFMWISTAGGGLSRYDGYEFVNYTPNNHQCKLKSNLYAMSVKTPSNAFGSSPKGERILLTYPL